MQNLVAEHIPGLSAQAVVQIAIVDGVIHVYPQRRGETTVYNCRPGTKPPASLPREVRWVVTGLEPGQRLRIQPKDESSTLFGPVPEVASGSNSTRSGPPAKMHGTGEATWSYGIYVYQGNDPVPVCSKDPGVVIKDWP